MIDDPQLLAIFRMESEERLAKLDSGLLSLEKNPADPELLEELFREMHSLKGAARMLHLLPIESTTHAERRSQGGSPAHACRHHGTRQQPQESACPDPGDLLAGVNACISGISGAG